MAELTAHDGGVADGTVVLHFGNPVVEQRHLLAGEAIAPLGDRAVVEVAGPDRLPWLDSITSQAVTTLGAGESTELLVLDPHGHIEHAAGVFDDGASSWLIVDAADAEPLAAWLRRMRFRKQVEVSVRDDVALWGFMGAGVASNAARAAALTPNGVPLVWADPWSAVQPGGWQYSHVTDHPAADWTWYIAIVPPDAAVPEPRAGALAAEALRIAAWRPRWATEVADDRALPHESDWLRSAVHLSKGCYRGQETVAKVHNLGHPPRRLAMLLLDGSQNLAVAVGDAVQSPDGKDVGFVTSVGQHHELGPIALALLKRSAPSGELTVVTSEGPVAAGQDEIVPPDAGSEANIPKITRLSRRKVVDPPS